MYSSVKIKTIELVAKADDIQIGIFFHIDVRKLNETNFSLISRSIQHEKPSKRRMKDQIISNSQSNHYYIDYYSLCHSVADGLQDAAGVGIKSYKNKCHQ